MRLALLCLFTSGYLAAQPAIPRYEVKRAAAPLVIDGKLDEKAWQAADPIVLIFPWESQSGAKQKTTVRALWDDQNLYAGGATAGSHMRGPTQLI